MTTKRSSNHEPEKPSGFLIEGEGVGGVRPPIGNEIEHLSRLHKRHQDGQGWALFQALEFCFVRAFDMPGWAVGALLAGMDRYRRGAAADLGEAFGVPRKPKRKKPFAGALFPLKKPAGYLFVSLDEYVKVRYPSLRRTGQAGETGFDLLEMEIRKNLDCIGMSKVAGPSARAIRTAWEARKANS
jgi:hypothetical protein